MGRKYRYTTSRLFIVRLQVDTSAAAAQLIKILTPYSGIVIGNNNDGWIDTSFSKTVVPGTEKGSTNEDGDGQTKVILS